MVARVKSAAEWFAKKNHIRLPKSAITKAEVTLESTGFTPASLFTGSDNGAWYDPSDLSTLCQTHDGTSGNVSVGDPVGRIDDKSGNGNHATQPTAALRPTLRQTAGGLYYLECDGVDDDINSGTIFSSGYTEATSIGAVQYDENTGDNQFRIFGIGYGVDPVEDSGAWLAPDDSIRFNGGAAGNYYTAIFNEPVIHTVTKDGTTYVGRQNAVAGADATFVGATSRRVGIFKQATGSEQGRFYGGVTIERLLTSQELEDTEGFFAEKVGVVL